jgi:hypothetical protein
VDGQTQDNPTRCSESEDHECQADIAGIDLREFYIHSGKMGVHLNISFKIRMAFLGSHIITHTHPLNSLLKIKKNPLGGVLL